MIYLSYIVFWIILPLACIYFRLKKNIGTGFAIGMVLTSFLLGFITANTFEERNEDRFVILLNERKMNEAEKVLVWILQKDPDGINRIDKTRIIDPASYRGMKDKLEMRYMGVVTELMKKHRLPDTHDCNRIDEYTKSITKLEHATRILYMAENLGKDRHNLRDQLKERVKKGKAIVSKLEEKCK